MNSSFKKVLLSSIILAFMTSTLVAKENPPVKKSKSGICHPEGGSYYKRTKNFISFKTMDACIKSGGRAAKR